MTTTLKTEFKAPSQKVAADFHPVGPIVLPSLEGTWTNVNHATEDIVKAVITASGSKLEVELFGACVPTPCDWGKVSAVPYAASVSSSKAIAFTANFNFGFSQVIATGHLQGKDLILEIYTVFTDGSGRSSYYASNTMVK
jgi:hypothetical protein